MGRGEEKSGGRGQGGSGEGWKEGRRGEERGGPTAGTPLSSLDCLLSCSPVKPVPV